MPYMIIMWQNDSGPKVIARGYGENFEETANRLFLEWTEKRGEAYCKGSRINPCTID
jgi:hypothetical protein